MPLTSVSWFFQGRSQPQLLREVIREVEKGETRGTQRRTI